MARVPEAVQHDLTGLYAWLVDREEQAHERPACTLPWTPEQPSYTGTPERLAAFRAGEPVALRAWDLPKWARGGERKEFLGNRRAVVWPDGSVQIRVTTAQEMLDDLGL
jgi:hypothetical protein